MKVIVGMSVDMYVYMQYIWMLSTAVARHYEMLNALRMQQETNKTWKYVGCRSK